MEGQQDIRLPRHFSRNSTLSARVGWECSMKTMTG